MKARVTVLDAAYADIDEIERYLLREADVQTTLMYMADFEALFDRLSIYPEIGAPRPRWGSGFRAGIVSPYLIPYVFKSDLREVFVVRVLHGARRISRKLLSVTPSRPL